MGDVMRRVDAAGVAVGRAMGEQVLHRRVPSRRRRADGRRRVPQSYGYIANRDWHRIGRDRQWPALYENS
jgi:hypothetical protein